MSIIALLNIAKEYLITRRTNEALRHLDNSQLNDIGFYRKDGVIRPLAKNTDEQPTCGERFTAQLKERPNDG
ncbi:hypothetical protein OFY17_08685 [Marinomonas sp. C2222]|uniref:DUF1127 domain-containing protein n=1 Tax=Marinomonas sargassi TaxID=2984494 RepID=A0ABT2YST8_9GAMM|nr:hypothetical protein [Marinomonas sargassi]MCV2402954.1 hypothetical protein [Marinomonas sargassi]